jgi:cell division protein ZapA
MDDHSTVVNVEIHGQRYPIRSGLDPAYVAELAAHVDEKIRLAIKECPGGDTLKIAVLAALNIADEYYRACNDVRHGHDAMARRAEALEHMLDLALGVEQPAVLAR